MENGGTLATLAALIVVTQKTRRAAFSIPGADPAKRRAIIRTTLAHHCNVGLSGRDWQCDLGKSAAAACSENSIAATRSPKLYGHEIGAHRSDIRINTRS